MLIVRPAGRAPFCPSSLRAQVNRFFAHRSLGPKFPEPLLTLMTSPGSISRRSRIYFAKTSEWVLMRSRASSRVMSLTPIQRLESSGGSLTKFRCHCPYLLRALLQNALQAVIQYYQKLSPPIVLLMRKVHEVNYRRNIVNLMSDL